MIYFPGTINIVNTQLLPQGTRQQYQQALYITKMDSQGELKGKAEQKPKTGA
jgi:hypothetical protein